MSKKLNLAICTAALLALTACTADDPALPGGDGNVTFDLTLPAGLATRADFGTGAGANQLTFVIYDVTDGNPSLVYKNEQTRDFTTAADGKRHCNLNVELVNGRSYEVLWWAQNPDCKAYSLDETAKTITVTYGDDMTVNDDSRDAFYAYTEAFTVKGAMTHEVTLTRPFAQVNFGTNDVLEDGNTSLDVAYGKDLAKLVSKIEVKGAPNVLNLKDGTTSTTAAEDAVITFGYAAPEADADFPVSGNKYLAMAYILAGQNGLADLTLSVSNNSSNVLATVSVSNAPVKANYRTNIYGKLLTSTNDFDVTLTPAFTGSENRELKVWTGGDVNKLTEMIAEGGAISVAAPVETIDIKSYLAADHNSEPLELHIDAAVDKIDMGKAHFETPVKIVLGKDVPYPAFSVATNTPYTFSPKNFTLEADPESTATLDGGFTVSSSYEDVSNVAFKNVKFKKQNSTRSDAFEIYASNCDNISIDGCTFENYALSAVRIHNENESNSNHKSMSNVSITNCIFTYDQATINTGSCNGLYISYIDNVVLKGNTVKGSSQHGIFVRPVKNMVIEGNTVETKRDGIKVENRVAGAKAIVKDNWVKAGENIVRLVVSANDCFNELSGNYFDCLDGTEPNGILVKGENPASSFKLVAKGNKKLATLEDAKWYSLSGLTLTDDSDIDDMFAE